MASSATIERGGEARERLLSSAYELFSRRGIRAVGVEEVIADAHVAKATFYRHFPSKDDLVLAFLVDRERRWTHEWLEAEAKSRADTPAEQLLAIFDVFDEWFHREEFEGCSFINVLLEMGPGHELTAASAVHLENIRDVLRSLGEQAGIVDLDGFARSFHILMKGSIVSAAEGDLDAARRAKAVGRLVLAAFGAQTTATAA